MAHCRNQSRDSLLRVIEPESKAHWELVLGHFPSSPRIIQERYSLSHDEDDCRKVKTEKTVLLEDLASTPAKDSSVNPMSGHLQDIQGKRLRHDDQLLFADKHIELKKRLEHQKKLLLTEKEAMARFQTSPCLKFFSGTQRDDGSRLKVLHAAITLANQTRCELSRGILANEELSRQMDLFESEIDRLFEEALQKSRVQKGC